MFTLRRHEAGYDTNHSPPAIMVVRIVPGKRYRCARSVRVSQSARSRRIASRIGSAASIALTAPPSRHGGCGVSACPARPSTVMVTDCEPRVHTQIWPRVGSVQMPASARMPCCHAREGARAGGLLVGVGVDDQVAIEADTEARQRLRRVRHRRHAALHVEDAAAVEDPVPDLGLPRVARPTVDRLGRDDVDVAVQEERPPAAGPRKCRGELRPADEVQPGRDRRDQRNGCRVPAPRCRPQPRPPPGGRPGTAAARPRRAAGRPRRVPSCRMRRAA